MIGFRPRRPQSGHVAVALSTVALFAAVGGPSWAAGIITGDQLADDTITNRQVADDNLDATSLAFNSVGYAELAPGAVGSTSQIGDSVVRSSHILDGQVSGADLADLGVGNIDLGWNSVTSGKIADGNVLSADIQDATIQSSDVAAGVLGKSRLRLQTTTSGWYGEGQKISGGQCAPAGVRAFVAAPVAGAIPLHAQLYEANGSYGRFSLVQMSNNPASNTWGWSICSNMATAQDFLSGNKITVTWLLP